MSGESIPRDVQALREEFPAWTFGTVWASAADGPDARRIWAQKGGFLISGWNAEEVAREIYRIPGEPPAPAGDERGEAGR